MVDEVGNIKLAEILLITKNPQLPNAIGHGDIAPLMPSATVAFSPLIAWNINACGMPAAAPYDPHCSDA